ncbi:MAG: CHAP domain-containing protein [Coriobacteriia bacterium]|nr:CHAP domain-containing protein [Coriobacteriia bacterium]
MHALVTLSVAAMFCLTPAPALAAVAFGTNLGSYSGVVAYSNGYDHGVNGSYSTYGYQYQCVEYVNRYYVLALGHKNMRGTGNADQYFGTAASRGLEAYTNAGSVAPRPGDVLCSNGGDYGHVAIVREVGATYIRVIQQNWYNDSRDAAMTLSMSVSGGKYTVAGFNSSYPVKGWLHKPSAAPEPPAPPAANPVYPTHPGFTKYGNPDYWWPIGSGYAGTGIYTYCNGNVRANYARWTFDLSKLAGSGTYRVEAYIPSVNATTRKADYHISTSSGIAHKVVDQHAYYNVWVDLGTYSLAEGAAWVELDDATGEAYTNSSSPKIGFDAIRLTYVPPVTQPAPAPTPPEAVPAPPDTTRPGGMITVYRFYNHFTGTHFYTPSEAERDTVIATWPDVYRYEGIAYTLDPARNTQPLTRFYNVVRGSHFYTASSAEAETVRVQWPGVFRYEGLTYPVSTATGPGKLPVYRFYQIYGGSHFYTASEEEKGRVIAELGAIYSYEGVAFWLAQ